MTFVDSLLDFIAEALPWPPVAWDVPLTQRWGAQRVPGSTWSAYAHRWVTR